MKIFKTLLAAFILALFSHITMADLQIEPFKIKVEFDNFYEDKDPWMVSGAVIYNVVLPANIDSGELIKFKLADVDLCGYFISQKWFLDLAGWKIHAQSCPRLNKNGHIMLQNRKVSFTGEVYGGGWFEPFGSGDLVIAWPPRIMIGKWRIMSPWEY